MSEELNIALQAKLDAQAEELAALREFAHDAVSAGYGEIDQFAMNHNLLDEHGDPTPLLTGADATEAMQAKLDAKDKELEVLRWFAENVLACPYSTDKDRRELARICGLKITYK